MGEDDVDGVTPEALATAVKEQNLFPTLLKYTAMEKLWTVKDVRWQRSLPIHDPRTACPADAHHWHAMTD